MTRGLVIGKFYPPHAGHHYLINTALQQVDRLDVLVCARPDQVIDGSLRAQWLQEVHPQAKVRVIDDICDDANSRRWADYCLTLLEQPPDVVFTSEDYGRAFTDFLHCKHVLVDRERTQVPISASLIRSNPLQYLHFLEPCVRAFFVRRVCVLGAESTGTTTIARQLAEHYGTSWVPEYGRTYCETKLQGSAATEPQYEWESKEFEHIAEIQGQHEDQAARSSGPVLFCDTNVLATYVWHERYLGHRSKALAAMLPTRHYDLYLLTDCDIPFVQDGTRDGENIRKWMTDRFREELDQRKLTWEMLSGTKDERFLKAVAAVDQMLASPRRIGK
jgi:HTH-type transcriptional regulator, transcriptional repressor of NAD biosynthesis genes